MAVVEPPSGRAAVAADLGERIGAVLARYARDDCPGVALGVVRAGELVLERYVGMADLELDVPMGPQALFDIASTSKQFTAAMTLLLSDGGRLDLDAPVRTYIPELPAYGDPEPTVRHLVHHTAGVRDYIALRHVAGIDDRDWFGMQDVLDHVVAQRGLNFTPGTRHLYSNSGYVLLAHIVARLTGVSFGEACNERIFTPLGMESSRFREDSSLILRGMVQMYRLDENEQLRKVVVNDDVVGDGALLTTLRDLARWEANYVHGTVGGADFFERMAAPGTPPDEEERYGFGLHSGEYRGLRTVGHGGNLHGFCGEFLRFPDHRLTVICLANHGGYDSPAIARRVADVFLGDVMQPADGTANDDGVAADIAAAEAQPYAGPDDVAGQYRDADTGMVFDLGVGDDGVLAVRLADIRLPFTHRAGRVFGVRYQDFDLTAFVTESRELRFVHEGEVLMKGAAIEPPPADALALDDYAGDYVSDEVPGVATLSVEDGTLVLARGRAKPDRLRPALPDEFATSFGSLRFHRGDSRRVTGFAASMSRTWGVEYRRKP
jgi:CubicO group peptidase (beta-lactamase class C family)